MTRTKYAWHYNLIVSTLTRLQEVTVNVILYYTWLLKAISDLTNSLTTASIMLVSAIDLASSSSVSYRALSDSSSLVCSISVGGASPPSFWSGEEVAELRFGLNELILSAADVIFLGPAGFGGLLLS